MSADQGIDGGATGRNASASFLKKGLGLKWRRLGTIPLPPKKTLEEHGQIQTEFLQTQLQPVLKEAKAGREQVFFVDAAHFVRGSFLCCVWCVVRMMIRGASGRERYNVLGAWNAITHELVRVGNTTRISSDTMLDLLQRIARIGKKPTTLVLDNARYQHCAKVKEQANQLGIKLMFLPSYSPNLNLIERLWKYTKKKALRGKHYQDFQAFQAAIDDCLDQITTAHKTNMESLMTLNFQTFDTTAFLAA
jgi:transposase